MASRGNMKPESSTLGSRKKNDACIACACARRQRRDEQSEPQVGDDEQQRRHVDEQHAAPDRHAEQQVARPRSTAVICIMPHQHVGRDLAQHDLGAA